MIASCLVCLRVTSWIRYGQNERKLVWDSPLPGVITGEIAIHIRSGALARTHGTDDRSGPGHDIASRPDPLHGGTRRFRRLATTVPCLVRWRPSALTKTSGFGLVPSAKIT